MAKKYIPRLGTNNFTLAGKVLKKDVKYSPKGNAYGYVKLEIPRGEDGKFKTYLSIKVFDEFAEEIAERVNEGDNMYFSGYIKNSNYEKDGVKIYKDDFVAMRYGSCEESAAEDNVGESSVDSN